MPSYPEAKTEYRVFDHTADLGVLFYGESLEGLFLAAARGIFDLICRGTAVEPRECFTIDVEGLDVEDLLVNWLRELLALHQTKGRLLSRFEIEEINGTHIKGRTWGEPFDPAKHTIEREIKAITYHGLEVVEREGKWEARVVFDV